MKEKPLQEDGLKQPERTEEDQELSQEHIQTAGINQQTETVQQDVADVLPPHALAWPKPEQYAAVVAEMKAMKERLKQESDRSHCRRTVENYYQGLTLTVVVSQSMIDLYLTDPCDERQTRRVYMHTEGVHVSHPVGTLTDVEGDAHVLHDLIDAVQGVVEGDYAMVPSRFRMYVSRCQLPYEVDDYSYLSDETLLRPTMGEPVAAMVKYYEEYYRPDLPIAEKVRLLQRGPAGLQYKENGEWEMNQLVNFRRPRDTTELDILNQWRAVYGKQALRVDELPFALEEEPEESPPHALAWPKPEQYAAVVAELKEMQALNDTGIERVEISRKKYWGDFDLSIIYNAQFSITSFTLHNPQTNQEKTLTIGLAKHIAHHASAVDGTGAAHVLHDLIDGGFGVVEGDFVLVPSQFRLYVSRCQIPTNRQGPVQGEQQEKIEKLLKFYEEHHRRDLTAAETQALLGPLNGALRPYGKSEWQMKEMVSFRRPRDAAELDILNQWRAVYGKRALRVEDLPFALEETPKMEA